MTPAEFVAEFVHLKRRLLQTYMSGPNLSAVGARIASLKLDPDQTNGLQAVLDGALTDAFYTVLTALDGEASLGKAHVRYQVYDDGGNLLSGELEGPAYDAFHDDAS